MSAKVYRQLSKSELQRIRESLKRFVRDMKKIGICPKIGAEKDLITIAIDLDDIVRIIRNHVESAVTPQCMDRYRVSVKRVMNLMVVEVRRVA